MLSIAVKYEHHEKVRLIVMFNLGVGMHNILSSPPPESSNPTHQLEGPEQLRTVFWVLVTSFYLSYHNGDLSVINMVSLHNMVT